MNGPDLVGSPPSGMPETFAGLSVLVLGLGRFGGGVETARFLQREGARCVISDTAPRTTLEAPAAAAEALGAELVFGPQEAGLIEGRGALIVSPAVPLTNPVVRAAIDAGIPVTTEMNIVLTRAPAPVFGVTGTKGKSTTVSLLAHMLEAAGRRVHLGGNIGRPLVGVLDAIRPDDRIVLEMSSFQLWWAHQIRRSPHVSLVTNLFGDHLDRHGTPEAYADAKRAVLAYQGPDDVAILPAADAQVEAAGFAEAGEARRVRFAEGSDAGVDLQGLPLLGRHNRLNALAAATAARQDPQSTPASIREGALATRPLPHRMNPVAEIEGVRFVDDSNATNPHSTTAALTSFDRPIVLILGGKDKGVDTSALLTTVRTRAQAVVGIGTTGPALVAALGDALPTAIAATMDEAVRLARGMARSGDIVLLSPGYSSLDQFVSFAARGEAFRSAVLESGAA